LERVPIIRSPSASLCSSPTHSTLHSFPTRRSSDLLAADLGAADVQRHAGLGWPLARGSRERTRHRQRSIEVEPVTLERRFQPGADRKSTRLNSSHLVISYAVFCLKKKTRSAKSSRE